MKNNVGTILGGIALVVGLANSYFLYDLSSKSNTDGAVVANAQSNADNTAMQAAPAQQVPQEKPAAPSEPPTTITFKELEHNFGKVKQESENKYEFSFTNTGKNPLIITDAKGSCGCTVPEYPHEPIAPGASNKIKVVYKPGGQSGQQNKTVTITANTEPQQTVIAITADVIK